jgi:hypothetical protein
MLHRQRKLLAKLQTILLGTMYVLSHDCADDRFPPVLICLILLATADTKAANIGTLLSRGSLSTGWWVGDYRRVIRVLLPSFYYLSPLHSIVTRIGLKEAFSSEDDATNPDSIPLSPKTSQWPEQERGQHSTIHIDPLRGKFHSVIGATSTSQGVGGGLVCLRYVEWANNRNPMLGLLKAPLDSSLSLILGLTDLIHHLDKQDIRSKRIQSTSLLL